MNKEVKISASKLKLFQECSWKYWCRYHLKLPDKTNYGALMGTECHTIFECLLNPRHKKLYDQIMTLPATIVNSPVIERHVRRYMRKYDLPDELFNKIDSMVIVGLLTDFFCKGGELLAPEFAFSIQNESPQYSINGKIDKPVKYGKYIRIADYKSSKKKFEGKDLEINVQAMMYSLASRRIWPDLIPIVDFIFLQFPSEPLQRLKFSKNQLDGFEHFLGEVTKEMMFFDENRAKKNMAASHGFLPQDEGFKGRLMCGYAKEPGQLKKDGSPMFHCPYKFGFEYFALCNDHGDVLKSSMKNDLKPNEEAGEFVIKKKYKGCPSFQPK